MEQWEIEAARQDAASMKDEYKRLQRGKELLQAEEITNASNAAYVEGVKEALKEAGIPESDWGSIYLNSAPVVSEVSRAIGKKYATKTIQKLAKRAGVVRDPKTGQFVKTAPTAQGQPTEGGLKGIAEQQRAGRLNSDQCLDRMLKTALSGYFEQSLKQG
jgi:hypothetical protein